MMAKQYLVIAFDNHFENCKFHLRHLFCVRRVCTSLKWKPTRSLFDCNALFENQMKPVWNDKAQAKDKALLV